MGSSAGHSATKVKLEYEGVALSRGDDDEVKQRKYLVDESGDLLACDYADNAEGQADDLQVTLRDREGLWRNEWLPQKGALLRATIFPAFGNGQLETGDMWIDEIEVGGPPSLVTIRATSVPVDEEVRGTKKTRAWEAVTYRKMAEAIAKSADLDLFYKGAEVEIERTDQHEETDLALLKRLGEDYGFVIKVSDSVLVVYDQEILETADSVATVDVTKGDGLVKTWSIRSKTRDVYRAARVMYRNPIHKIVADYWKDHPSPKDIKEPVYVAPKRRGKSRRLTNAQKEARYKARVEKAENRFAKKHDHYLDQLIRQERDEERRQEKDVEVDDWEFLFAPDGAPVVGGVLEVEKRVKDLDAAKRLAQRALRNANKDEVMLGLDLVGDIAMRGGLNIDLIGAGKFSGKYHIEQARHSIGAGGYTTSVTAHRVLVYTSTAEMKATTKEEMEKLRKEFAAGGI
jgi:phage protein D